MPDVEKAPYSGVNLVSPDHPDAHRCPVCKSVLTLPNGKDGRLCQHCGNKFIEDGSDALKP